MELQDSKKQDFRVTLIGTCSQIDLHWPSQPLVSSSVAVSPWYRRVLLLRS